LNLYNFCEPEKGESFDTLFEHKNIRVVRIVSSNKLEEKMYCQREDEWLVVIKKSAILEIDGKIQTLSEGDTCFIPAHIPHRVIAAQSGTLWLTIHIF